MAKMDSIKMEGYLLYFKKKQACVRKTAPLFFFKVAKQIEFSFFAEVSTAKQYHLNFVFSQKSVCFF